jgi:hypothetical protein
MSSSTFLHRAIRIYNCSLVWFGGASATFNNISDISWRSDLLVGEMGVPGVAHRPPASH